MPGILIISAKIAWLMQLFDDWKEKSKVTKIYPSLLWEYDMSCFDWYAMRTVMVYI